MPFDESQGYLFIFDEHKIERTGTKAPMNSTELLLLIRRFRLWILGFAIAVFFIAAYKLQGRVLQYESDCSFFIASDGIINPSILGKGTEDDVLKANSGYDRLYQFGYSNEMMMFLIKKFDLYKHYGVDTTKAFHYEVMVGRLNRRISFKQINGDVVNVHVRDRNNEIAAAMANAIAWKLDQLNKSYLVNKMQNNISFYETFLKESENLTRDQSKILQQSIESFRDAVQRQNSKQSYSPLSDVEFSVYEAANDIRDITGQLIKAKNLYVGSLKNMQARNTPSVIVIKKALPEMNSKKKYLLLFAALCSLLVIVAAVSILYFYFSYKKELGILFGIKPISGNK